MEEAVCEIVTETFEGFEARGSEWRSSWDRVQGHIRLGLERRELAKRVMRENVTTTGGSVFEMNSHPRKPKSCDKSCGREA